MKTVLYFAVSLIISLPAFSSTLLCEHFMGRELVDTQVFDETGESVQKFNFGKIADGKVNVTVTLSNSNQIDIHFEKDGVKFGTAGIDYAVMTFVDGNNWHEVACRIEE